MEDSSGRDGQITRRRFLKSAVVGAGALAAPMVFGVRKAHAYQPGQSVHPNIPPLRVVGLTDEEMTTDRRVRINWQDQEQLVNTHQVGENIDRLACALAEEKSEKDAWSGIFIRPPGKAWSDVKVAIKTNNIAQQHTHSAVMAKICRVLTGVVGIAGKNICIYDGRHGGNLERSTPYKGLPDGVRIVNTWGGISAEAPVPGPWQDGRGTSQCVPALARGEADILVDIALCKGHASTFGNFTMSCKNHFGTFSPGPGHRAGADDYVLCINKSEAILGPQDARGRVTFPRQQLVLIDSLWASRGGPGGHPDHQPNALFMGSFGPAVDYQVATKFRLGTMGWPINKAMTNRFLTEFGFKRDQLPGDGAIIDAAQFPV